MSSIRVGIASYAQPDAYGVNHPPHWALVAHPTHFDANDVKVFQITRDDEDNWVETPKTCSLRKASNCVGVVDLGVAHMSLKEFEDLATRFEADEANLGNPSKREPWGCSNWVIRILYYLDHTGSFCLGCIATQVYNVVSERMCHMAAQPKSDTLKTVKLF